MGYDLFGNAPKSEDGGYFRANIWSWPSIMELVEEVKILPRDVVDGMYWNDGQEVSSSQAQMLADAIESYIGEIDDEMEYVATQANNITKLGTALLGALQSSGVDIQGEPALPYSTNASHIKEFIKFCRESGGFQVC